MKLLGMELGLDLGLANPKPRNRRRKEGQRWQWPQIDWRRYSFALSGLAGVLAFVALLVIALDQPITSVSVQGRFQRVSPMDVEQAVRERVRKAGLVTVDLAGLQASIKRLPWVDQASVARVWPRGLEVRVVEQVAAARWGTNGLLNARGELFLAESRFMPPELPRLSGPAGTEGMVAQRYLAIQGRLVEGGLRIAALRLDARGAWEIDLDNGVSIRLGRRQVDERFERFVAAALALVVQRAADVAYVDMRYTNGFAVGWRGGTRVASAAAIDPDDAAEL
jgi:cell division protein FtsQ